MNRCQVMEVQHPRLCHRFGLSEHGCPCDRDSLTLCRRHPREGAIWHSRARLKRRMHRKRRIHRILAPSPPRDRVVVLCRHDVHTGENRLGVAQCPSRAERSTRQRDRPAEGLKRT